MQVLDRAVTVLAALEGGPLRLAELVTATGLARATTHRLATALEIHGLVARDSAGRWLLGPAIGRLAAAAGGSSLAALSSPFPGRRRLGMTPAGASFCRQAALAYWLPRSE